LLLKTNILEAIRREEDFNKMIKMIGRLYDYSFPATDWYIGLAAQATESEYFSKLCSFPMAMQHHDERAAERKRQQMQLSSSPSPPGSLTSSADSMVFSAVSTTSRDTQ
jgi:hypothetical protein